MKGPDFQVCGTGNTILYIPGIEGTAKLLYKQIDDLSRDHTIIAMPYRSDGPYEIEQISADIRWILDQTGSNDVTVLAESFGGLVAMSTAISNPGLFGRMILVNTFPWFEQRTKISVGFALSSVLPYSVFKAYRTGRSRDELFSDDISTEDRVKFHELTRVVGFGGYQARLKIIRDTDLRPRLKDVRIPTLVVAGDNDRLFNSVRYGQAIVASIPRAKLKILEGTGHIALLADGVRVREWLADFGGF